MPDTCLEMTRRPLLQAAALPCAGLAIPGLTGCAYPPKYRPVGAQEGRTLYLLKADIADVERGSILENRTIAIERGIITGIFKGPPVLRNGDATLDLEHRCIIPGLIDAHCHATLPGQSSLNPWGLRTTMRQLRRNYIQQLRQGVTTIRDMGAMPKLLHYYMKRIEAGTLMGPRVVYCNAFTNIHGGHPDLDPASLSMFAAPVLAVIGSSNLWFKDEVDLREKMEANTAGGASFMKLTMDGISVFCGKGRIPVYSGDHLQTIVDFAEKNGLATAGHVHTGFGFDRALRYGINSVEHSLADRVVTEQDAREMVRKNIATVPTVTVAQAFSAPEAWEQLPKEYRTDFIDREMELRRHYLHSSLEDYIEPSIHHNNMAHLANYRTYGCENLYANGRFMANPSFYFDMLRLLPENIRTMNDAGVLVGCGTDAGVPFCYHGTLWREMEMLHRLGLTRAEVLRCATINNATILGMADSIGSVSVGKRADLVILDGNPLKTLEPYRKPRLVIREGLVYDPQAMDLTA